MYTLSYVKLVEYDQIIVLQLQVVIMEEYFLYIEKLFMKFPFQRF